jgi:superfamily II DNA or RNA helicase
LQTVPTPGEVVRVRGRLWTVGGITRHHDCAALDLTPAVGAPRLADPEYRHAELAGITLLTPFDRPVRIPTRRAPLVVSRRRWMASFRAALCRNGARASLHAAARSDLVLMPHQLEPAIETILHGSPRILLADAVGLGKTIQAGIVIAELVRRRTLERALILTPPGLRDQWADELLTRFGLATTIADTAWLRAMRAEWPASLNPWSVPGVLIASIDFAKRPEVRRSLDDVWWDVVVIDEAHAACGDSDRREAAHRSASRARRVLLLTATPHAGDDAAFDALARIGALADDDPIALFRRSRADVGLPSRRRVRLLRVRGTAAEAAVHRALREYVRAVWTRTGDAGRERARLAMVVLVKRSLSGMMPLLRSLEARHDALADSSPSGGHQLGLPWDDGMDEADKVPIGVLGAPGLNDVTGERAWLARIIVLACEAAASDSKLCALRRLLRRIREPVIVFTEYRDTLASIAASLGTGDEVAVLHGGLDRAQRADVTNRFTQGRVQRLIATDAAGAGLNLQARCRVVVNLELPWNPMRLEQRIGRVDRIGQARTVHAINLLARGTAEAAILARLARRLAKADAVVGSIEQVLGWTDQAIAERWIGVRQPDVSRRAHAATGVGAGAGVGRELSPETGAATATPACARALVHRPDRRQEAATLALELQQHRAFRGMSPQPSVGAVSGAVFAGAACPERSRREASACSRQPLQIASSCVACAITMRRRPRPIGAGGVLAIVHIGDELVPVFVARRVPRLRRRAHVRAAVDAFLHTDARRIVRRAEEAVAARQRQQRTDPVHPGGLLAARDDRLAALPCSSSRLRQPGLFDRRNECAPTTTLVALRRGLAGALRAEADGATASPPEQSRRRKPAPTTVREATTVPDATTVQDAATVTGCDPVPDGAVPADSHDRDPADRAPVIALLLFITAEGGAA